MTDYVKINIAATLIELVFKSGKPISFYATNLAEVKSGIYHILDWRSKHLGQEGMGSTSDVRFKNCKVSKLTNNRVASRVDMVSLKSGVFLTNSESELRNYIDECLIEHEAARFNL